MSTSQGRQRIAIAFSRVPTSAAGPSPARAEDVRTGTLTPVVDESDFSLC